MFTTVATVKQAIIDRGTAPPAAHDAEIQRLIDVLSADLEAFCGRKFAQTSPSGEPQWLASKIKSSRRREDLSHAGLQDQMHRIL